MAGGLHARGTGRLPATSNGGPTRRTRAVSSSGSVRTTRRRDQLVVHPSPAPSSAGGRRPRSRPRRPAALPRRAGSGRGTRRGRARCPPACQRQGDDADPLVGGGPTASTGSGRWLFSPSERTTIIVAASLPGATGATSAWAPASGCCSRSTGSGRAPCQRRRGWARIPAPSDVPAPAPSARPPP